MAGKRRLETPARLLPELHGIICAGGGKPVASVVEGQAGDASGRAWSLQRLAILVDIRPRL